MLLQSSYILIVEWRLLPNKNAEWDRPLLKIYLTGFAEPAAATGVMADAGTVAVVAVLSILCAVK